MALLQMEKRRRKLRVEIVKQKVEGTFPPKAGPSQCLTDKGEARVFIRDLKLVP